MTKKYRETVNKPLKYIGTKIKKIADIDAPTKPKKVLKGSALVGMTLIGFMLWFAKFVALDNKLMRKLEKKLSEIKVGKDKNGYEKKFQAL